MQVGNLNKQFVTAVSFLDNREIRSQIIDASNEMGYTDLLALAGLSLKTTEPVYRQFTDEDLYKVLVIDTAGVSGSGTATLVITLSAATSLYARSGMVLKFSNDKAGYISSTVVTSGGKDTFTVKSVDGTNLTAVAADKMFDIGTMVGEGSLGVTNIIYTVTSDFNLVQRLRTIDVVTDVQKESYITVTVDGKQSFVNYQSVKKAQAFQGDISKTLLGGTISVLQYSDGTLVDSQGNPTQFTGGLHQQMATKGVQSPVTTNGAFVFADLDNECDALNAVKSPKDFLKLCPDKSKRIVSTFFKGLQSSGVVSAKLNFNANEITAFNYNVEKVVHGSFTFEYGHLPILDHPQGFGAGVGTIGKSIFGIPKGNVNTIGNGPVPRIRMRYMDHGIAAAGSNMIAEWQTGAMAMPTPTNDAASLTKHWLTNVGNEMAGTKQFSLQRSLS
jgi:predicted transcriptional regulator